MTVESSFPFKQIVVGEHLEFDVSFSDYPSSEYTLTYYFSGVSSLHPIPCTSNDDDTFHFSADADAEEGDYTYQAKAVHNDTGNAFIVDNGKVKANPDLSTKTVGYDDRTVVKRTLDALMAMAEGKASNDQLYYMIEGRALSRIPPQDLVVWIDRYKQYYAQELREERFANGKGQRKIKVRFR